MDSDSSPPKNPVGPFEPVAQFDEQTKNQLIETIRQAPKKLSEAVSGLTVAQLDTLYKNWTIRQIVHHLADSHVNSYIRVKWTLTEDNPTIKAYEEGDWALLPDAHHGDIEPSLVLFKGLHAKWVQVLLSLKPEQYARTFYHPQTEETVSLWTALNYYAWHSRHHTGQIVWLRQHHGW